MTFTWKKLPESLEAKLLTGTVGKMHITGLVNTALQIPEGAYVPLGVDMLLAAWEADPLDGVLAGQLRQFLPETSQGLRILLDGLAQPWEPDAYILRLQEQRKMEKLFEMLEKKLTGEDRTLFHLQRAVELGPAEFPVDWTKRFFGSAWPRELHPVLEYVLAGLDLLTGDVEQAKDRCRKVLTVLPLPGVQNRLGECEYRLGNREQALAQWRDALAKRPWDVSLLLKTYDVDQGLDQARVPLDGPVNILLYTYDKADELNQSLEALANSELGDAKITVLDNGCQDTTADVIKTWQENFGPDTFASVTLPVNVGAPAARNWLMRLEDVRARPWTIYLDDDAIVPSDWLGRMGAAVRAYPDAGVWGCKVVDAELAHVIQNADLHPRPDYAQQGTYAPGEMSDLHHQVFDVGGFDYVRPCASVTGCCHLFKTKTLLECGDFDLSFSPSQFDDLDHDLRLVLDGKLPVYQGHLAVRHMKRSGKLAGQGGFAFFSGLANHEKLKAKHGGEQWDRVRATVRDALRKDVVSKWEQLKG